MLKHSFILFVWVMLSLSFTESYLCALQTVTCVVQFLCCTVYLCVVHSYVCVVQLSLCCSCSLVQTVIAVLYSYLCVLQLSLCCTDSYLCVVQLSLCCTDSYLCVVQTVAMLNEEELRKEVTMLERTLRVKLCMQKLLSRPRLSESMGESLLLFFFFHWE